MKKTEDISQIKNIIKEIRDQQFPAIPLEVLDRIIDIQSQYSQDETTANKEITNYLTNFLKSIAND